MTQEEYDREFDSIVENLGYDPSIARTLTGYLWAAAGQHRAQERAIEYTIDRLWVKNPKKGSVT